MTDVLTKKQRSHCMSQIKGKGNRSTEMRMIEILKKHGITGWRRNHKLYGKPDFVFPKTRIALFVDGDFWHGHPTRAKIPSNNRKFWKAKIEANKRRDKLVNKTLKNKGWKVVRIWESDLRLRPRYCANRVLTRLNS